MKIKLLVGALVLLMLINVGALVAFLVVRPGSGPSDWRPGARMQEGARGRAQGYLSRDERRKLRDAMAGFHEETRDLAERTSRLENDVIASMKEDPVPRARVDSLLGEIAEGRLEIARRATDRMIEMGETLTPEEREHIMSAIMRIRGGMGGPPHRGWKHERNQ